MQKILESQIIRVVLCVSPCCFFPIVPSAFAQVEQQADKAGSEAYKVKYGERP